MWRVTGLTILFQKIYCSKYVARARKRPNKKKDLTVFTHRKITPGESVVKVNMCWIFGWFQAIRVGNSSIPNKRILPPSCLTDDPEFPR